MNTYYYISVAGEIFSATVDNPSNFLTHYPCSGPVPDFQNFAANQYGATLIEISRVHAAALGWPV